MLLEKAATAAGAARITSTCALFDGMRCRGCAGEFARNAEARSRPAESVNGQGSDANKHGLRAHCFQLQIPPVLQGQV
jgi:hypothetical protein